MPQNFGLHEFLKFSVGTLVITLICITALRIQNKGYKPVLNVSESMDSTEEKVVASVLEENNTTTEEDVGNIGVIDSHNTISQNVTKRDYMLIITMPIAGRLGNRMFLHAATIGIANSQGYTPAFETIQDHGLSTIFHISIKGVVVDKKERINNWYTFKERHSNMYDRRMENFTSDKNHYLKGYFQSWRYFSDPQTMETIREEFTFQDDTLLKAMAFVSNVTSKFERNRNLSSSTANKINLVGIHVRRGDLLESYNIAKGYLTAPPSYIHRAMRYFEEKYDPTNLLFIICTDDFKWTKLNIKQQKSPFVISENQQGIVDLAILTLCNDVIMTVGTFGWWAGWLAGGSVVYWTEWPKSRSSLRNHFNPKDYYPQHWIPMTA